MTHSPTAVGERKRGRKRERERDEERGGGELASERDRAKADPISRAGHWREGGVEDAQAIGQHRANL